MSSYLLFELFICRTTDRQTKYDFELLIFELGTKFQTAGMCVELLIVKLHMTSNLI